MPFDNSLEMTDKCFNDYSQLIHKLMGIHIEQKRKVMLVGRIKKRLSKLDLPSYENYLKLIKDDKDEKELFINLITTNETYFYRTPRVWDFITKDFLEKWFQNSSDKKLRIWSAASSTGEEAHTMGIICQNFKVDNPAFQYEILGTDISSRVVKKADQGLYIDRAIARFRQTQPELFKKYMQGDDEKGYRVIPEIKRNIKFELYNLFNRPKSNEKFNIILLRNVLIYFKKEDQQKVLQNAYNSLKKDGYLIIGESESLSRMETNFELVSPLIYKPKPIIQNQDVA